MKKKEMISKNYFFLLTSEYKFLVEVSLKHLKFICRNKNKAK